MKKTTLLFLIISLFIYGCSNSSKNKTKEKSTATLQDGTWRGVLIRPDGIKIPFNFEVKKKGSIFLVKNANQKLEADSIFYKGDSVYIDMKYFLSTFRLKLQKDGSLKGVWVQNFPKEDPVFKFSATPNTSYRIQENPNPPKFNISGRWRTYFINPKTKDSLLAVGLFEQVENKVTGTEVALFHHNRYLEGTVSGDSLLLSCFDGAHRVLIAGKITSKNTMGGVYYSGLTGIKKWVAIRDSTVKLPNASKITTYKPGEKHLAFSFRNLKGDTITLEDPEFKNKVTIVQLLGSWCINCQEETRFLNQWYKKNKDRGVRLIGLCFERSGEYKEAVKSAMTFKKGLNISYPLLITEVPLKDPNLIEKVLPQLQNFAGFPSTLFLDKKGNIAKIHAGGMAPSDPGYYNTFIQHFNNTIDSLLRENP